MCVQCVHVIVVVNTAQNISDNLILQVIILSQILSVEKDGLLEMLSNGLLLMSPRQQVAFVLVILRTKNERHLPSAKQMHYKRYELTD